MVGMSEEGQQMHCCSQTVLVIGLLVSVGMLVYSSLELYVPGFIVSTVGIVYCSVLACKCCSSANGQKMRKLVHKPTHLTR